MRKLLTIQVVFVFAVTVFLITISSFAAGIAALYGGAIALVNSFLLGRHVDKAKKNLKQSAQSDVALLYLGAAQRFVFTLVAMAVGMGLLKLEPVGLLAAFIAAQLAHLFAAGPRPDTA